MTSNVYKLYCSLINSEITKFCETENIFGYHQGAFRSGLRLENNIFTLKSLCSMRKNEKKKTFLCYLDISKAYDVIDRNLMFLTLWQRGIRGKIWRLLREMYRGNRTRLIESQVDPQNPSSSNEYNNSLPPDSPWFSPEFGLKQGCVLSTSIFSIIMSELYDKLVSANIGVKIDKYNLPCLMFADDIVLISKSEPELLKMMEISNDFAIKWGFKFSEKKSKVMVVGGRVNKEKSWPIGNLSLTEVSTYKYLGYYFHSNLQDSEHIKVITKNSKKANWFHELYIEQTFEY